MIDDCIHLEVRNQLQYSDRSAPGGVEGVERYVYMQ